MIYNLFIIYTLLHLIIIVIYNNNNNDNIYTLLLAIIIITIIIIIIPVVVAVEIITITYRLVGLVVKASASRVGGPGFKSR